MINPEKLHKRFHVFLSPRLFYMLDVMSARETLPRARVIRQAIWHLWITERNRTHEEHIPEVPACYRTLDGNDPVRGRKRTRRVTR